MILQSKILLHLIIAALTFLSIENASAITWENQVGVTTTHNSITKTGTTSAWDSGASSNEALTGNGFIEFQKAPHSNAMIGLSNGDSSVSYKDIDFALFFSSNSVKVYENGESKGSFGQFTSNDLFRVEVKDGEILFLKNNVVFYTSLTTPTMPLSIDTALYSSNVIFTNVSLLSTGVAAPSNAPILSSPTGTVTDTTPAFNWSSVIDASGYNLILENIDTNTVVIDKDLINTGFIHNTSFTPIANLEYGNYRWAVTAFNSSGNGPVSDDTFFDITDPNQSSGITWLNEVGVSTTPTSITKTAANGWTGGAISLDALTGNGYLEFQKETSSNAMFGLSNGDSSQSYKDIDYAIYLYSNNIRVYEKGSFKGSFGTFVTDDVFSVEVKDSNVLYLKNNTVFYTSLTTPVFPLNIDSSLYNNEMSISNISLVVEELDVVELTVADLSDNLRACINNDTLLLSEVTNVYCIDKPVDNNDIIEIASLNNLDKLFLSTNQQFTNISALNSLVNLTQLYILYNPQVDITSLNFNDLTSLSILKLWSLNLTQIPDLSSFSEMTLLDFNDNPIAGGFDNLPTKTINLLLLESNLSSCNSLAGKNIVDLRIGGDNFVSFQDCSEIVGLSNLSIGKSLNMNATQSVDSFAGICNLSMEQTNVEHLVGSRPIGNINLWANQNLKTIDTIKLASNPFDLDNDYPNLIPSIVYTTGSEAMTCSALYATKDIYDNYDATDLSQGLETTVAGVPKEMEACGSPNPGKYFEMPATCAPDAITGFSASIISQNTYSLDWSKQDHNIWQVTDYEIRVNGDNNDIRTYTSAQAQVLPIELNVIGASIASFEIRACVTTICGEWQSTQTQCDSDCTTGSYVSDDIAPITDVPSIEPVGDTFVGSIAGSFQADQMGQANYSIPILTGAGTAGLAPQISLNYSSGSGNGVAGVGWALSGTTIITRCRETEESRDGASSIIPLPITWSTQDKLCLNGERLYLVTGSNYWDDLSTYRTERDQFARVTYLSTTDTFTIERKDGSKAYYGDTSDSAIQATDVAGSPTYAWAISRFTDNMSNYIDYTYQQYGDLEFALLDVDYTGHLANPVLAPYNNISFNYENTRNDKTVAYIAGAKVGMTRRLASIDSSIDGTNVRTYTLFYNNSTHSNRSIMTSFSECRGSSCLPITTFDWSQPNVNFKTTSTGAAAFPRNLKSSKLGDINGDGRADLIFVDNDSNTFKVALANGSFGFDIGSITTISAPTGSEIDNKWHLIDFNADGRQDLLKQVGANWFVHLALEGTLGFSSSSIASGIPSTTADVDFQIVDMNGDGLADLLYDLAGLSVRYLEKNGSNGYIFSNTLINVDLPNHPTQIDGVPNPSCATNCINDMAYRFFTDDELNIRTHDVNGDGVADLILRSDVYQTTYSQRSNMPTEQPDYRFISSGQISSENSNTSVIQGGDVTTLMSSHWIAFIGQGIGSNGELDYRTQKYHIAQASSLFSDADKNIKFVDINADGLTDVLSKGIGESWQYALATGTGRTLFTQTGDITNSDHLQLFDHNGDGYIDLYYPSNFTNKNYYLRTWNGNGFSNATIQNTEAINLTSNVNLFLDLNGDGREDQLRIDSSGIQRIYTREDSYKAIDKIVEINNGFDAKTSIGYQALTFSTTYNQGTGANILNYGNGSPVFDYISSIFAVNSVSTDTPTQADANSRTTMTYQYKDARVQTGGRGFLGFGEIITSVPVKGSIENQNYLLQTQTTYNQEFPYIGLPKTVIVSQYEVAPIPPIVCTGDGSCFPPPCFPGQVCEDIQRASSGTPTPVLLSQTTNTFAKAFTAGKSQFAYINSTIEKTYAPNGSGLLKTRVQTSGHDSFGNPTNNTVKIYDGAYNPALPSTNLLHTTTSTNLYDNLTSNWKIGLLRSTSTTVSRPGKPSVNSLMQYDYNNTTGLLSEERRLPNDGADKFLRILHEYDNFGNELKTISCSGFDFNNAQCANTTNLSNDIPDSNNPTKIHRFNQLVFDAKGRYVNQVKNSLAQTVSTITSRDIYGNPLTTTDLLGTTLTNTYDTFGTAQTSYSSLGSWSYVSKIWCDDITGTSASLCPTDAIIRVTNKASGGALSYAFIDKLGRTISTTARSFNNNNDGSTIANEQWVINDQYYDDLGRAVTTVGPYFYGETNAALIPETNTEYDRYNRVTKVILPDGATEIINYSGFITSTTNALNQNKIETKNALGELLQAQDHLGNRINYIYNSQGLVTDIKRTADGSTELLIKNTYDKAGRKTKSEDVDTGTTLSSYNAEGEIIKVTDAKGQYVYTYRDELGRVDLTENFDSNGIKKLSTQQNYNPSSNQISSEVEFLGPDAFRRDYTYDSLKRLSSITTEFIDTENVCNNGFDCQFSQSLYYDRYSRSKIEQDASGKAIKNNYNSQGFLENITNADDESQQYYKINNTDHRGNITQDTKAANLVTDYYFDDDRGFMTDIINDSLSAKIWYSYGYDKLGNLRKRADIKDINNPSSGMSECLYYDSLNRLTDTRRYDRFNTNCNGNPLPSDTTEITSIGYNGKGNITSKDNQTYSYLNASPTFIGNSPHQVTQKGGQVYEYDANGNNTKMTNFQTENGSFQNRNIEYNTFNKVEKIWTGNDSSNPIAQSRYKYGTSRQKFARIDEENGQSKVTYFIGNVEIEYNGGITKYKRQLGNYAIITETGTNTTEAYLFTDHLGSIDTIADASGTILQQMSFSAWGERRLPTNWDQITIPNIRQQMDGFTNRGYTGHEMVDAFGIINMGGRLYDAALGRVLQADPFVQDPTNTQSFNRYTYVYNNPLSYTDPSGYFSLRQALGIAIGIATGILLGPLGFEIANVYWAAFFGGFASGAIITGSLKGALISGITAMATAAVTNNIFDLIKGNPATGLKGAAQTITEKTTEALSSPLTDGIISEISTTGKVLTQTSLKTGSQAAGEIAKGIDYIMDTATVIGQTFRELLASEIKRVFVEMWASSQVAMTGQKSVSLGQANIDGTTYNMSMNLPASNLERWIAGGVTVLSIGTAITQTGRNFVKKKYLSAKGKVQNLIKKLSRTPRIPGRVQSRINISNDGFSHVIKGHFDPSRIFNKSQFTISQTELKSLLGAKNTISSQVKMLESGSFARTITSDKIVGNLATKFGGAPTNVFSVITDKLGNILTAHPGGI